LPPPPPRPRQSGSRTRFIDAHIHRDDAKKARHKQRQHRTIWQEAPAWIFGSIQSLEDEGILYVFLVFQTEEVGQKGGCGSQTQLRGAAQNQFPL